MTKALILLLAGLPPILGMMFLPGFIDPIREELDWRSMKDPYEFLGRWPYAQYRRSALAALDEAQRPHGFITRLVSSAYGEDHLTGSETTTAVWGPGDREVLTGSSMRAVRWDAATGRQVATHGEATRRATEQVQKWGFGLREVAWYQGGTGVVALASDPQALWFFAPGAREPLVLDGDGHEALSAAGMRAAFTKSVEYGNVLDIASGKVMRLPHPDVTAIALADDGRVLTASRDQVLMWRDGVQQGQIPLRAFANPAGFSSDAAWVLVLAGQSAQLWSTADGSKRELVHASEVTAICASAQTVATGTDDGHVHLWSANDGKATRSFRVSTEKIDLLACSPTRLLTVAYTSEDARVWDMAGQAQSGPALYPAPPRISWITRLGADLDIPGKMPVLTQWMQDAAHANMQPWCFAALAGLVFAAQRMVRAEKRKR